MNIDHTQPAYIAKKRYPPPRVKPLALRMQKQKPFKVRVLKVDTEVTRHKYQRAQYDEEPMIFTIRVSCETQDKQRAYFSHKIPFVRTAFGENRFERYATDFVRIIPITPPPETSDAQVDPHNEVHLKISAGDTLHVVANWEEKVSSSGHPYLQLQRVHRV